MSDLVQVGMVDGQPVFAYASDKRPLAVGDVLHGFCGGIFGRDHYACCVVEAVGSDWVVVRTPDALLGTGVGLAAGRGTLKSLREHRKPTTDVNGDPCCRIEEDA